MKEITLQHIKQSNESSCGAAALSMVYSYFSKKSSIYTETKIWNRLKKEPPHDPGAFYMQTFDIALDGEKNGFHYFYGRTNMSSINEALQPIQEFLSCRIPVIVCQKISKQNHMGHFRVVISIQKNNIIVHDPMKNSKTAISKKEFFSLWRDAGNQEVVGGEFVAIFPKRLIKRKNTFNVLSFSASTKSFSATELVF